MRRNPLNSNFLYRSPKLASLILALVVALAPLFSLLGDLHEMDYSKVLPSSGYINVVDHAEAAANGFNEDPLHALAHEGNFCNYVMVPMTAMPALSVFHELSKPVVKTFHGRIRTVINNPFRPPISA